MKDKTAIIVSVLLGTIIVTSSYVMDELPEDVSYSEQSPLSENYDPSNLCEAIFNETLVIGKAVPTLKVTSDNNITIEHTYDIRPSNSEVFKDLKCN